MSYLLDTNVISELRKPAARVDAGVLDWSRRHPLEQLYVSSISIYEIELGVLKKEKQDPIQGALLRDWLETKVKATFQGRILPFDDQAAVFAARLHREDPRPLADSFIAATAQLHGLTVVTRNERDFSRIGVASLNPWSTGGFPQ